MITATFDGAERQFHIKPEYVGLFESALPASSIYATFRRFTDGNWTADDVTHVLSFALHGPSKEAAMIWRSCVQGAKYGMPFTGNIPCAPHPRVVEVVLAEGHGNFVSLVSDILTDVLLREQANADDAA